MITDGPRVERHDYRPALDGLRAAAVVSVIVFHSVPSWAPGGFLGVDVFFVLSGYLITGLLLAEGDRWGSIDLIGFYRARARRLLPALFVLVAVTSVVGPYVLTDGAKSALRGDAIASLLYVTNWRFIVEGNSYFQQIGDPSPLRHLWTLAIEEQYYVMFPVLLIGVLAVTRGRRRIVAMILSSLAMCSAALAAYMIEPGTDTSRVYFGTDTRVHELFNGAVLAVVLPMVDKQRLRHRKIWVQSTGALAIVAIVAAFAFAKEDSATMFRGGSVLFSLLVVAVLVAVETDAEGPLGRTLGRPAAALIGRLSYGLYLWHWPIIVFLSPQRTGWNDLPLFVIHVLLTFLFASVSYYLIEQPIRQGALRRVGRVKGRAIAVFVMPLMLLVVLWGTTGAPDGPPRVEAGGSVPTTIGEPDASQRILLVGDSVGFAWGYSFPSTKYPDVSVTGVVKQGCGTAAQWLVVNGEPWSRGNTACDDQFATWTTEVENLKPNLVIWSLGAWEVYDHYINSKVLAVGSQAYERYLTSQMEAGLQALGDSTQVVIPNVPCYAQPSYDVEGEDVAPDRNDAARGRAINSITKNFAAVHADRVHVVDAASWLCPDGKYVETTDGTQYRYDGVHYSEAGVAKFWEWIMPQIRPYLEASQTPASEADPAPR